MKYPFSTRYRASKGWTLVELLVAMALGLLIIAGIGQIYLAAKRSYDIQTSLSHLQDVGRYVTETLTQDIHRAGYWGLLDMQTAITQGNLSGATTPSDTCIGSSAAWGMMVREYIFGLNDSAGNYTCINRLQGDVLTLRYANPAQITTPYAGTSSYIRTTAFTGQVGTGPAGPLPSPPSDYIVDYELVAHAYYVANSTMARECGQNSAPAPFLPALDREYLNNNGDPRTEELVTSVEHLRFLYGVDTDGNSSANQYRNADEVTASNQWNDVRSVRFWVLVREDCPEAGYTDPNSYNMGGFLYAPHDGYRRALYTSTVALRN
jgi:type IV pilus assembly protein PilW